MPHRAPAASSESEVIVVAKYVTQTVPNALVLVIISAQFARPQGKHQVPTATVATNSVWTAVLGSTKISMMGSAMIAIQAALLAMDLGSMGARLAKLDLS